MMSAREQKKEIVAELLLGELQAVLGKISGGGPLVLGPETFTIRTHLDRIQHFRWYNV